MSENYQGACILCQEAEAAGQKESLEWVWECASTGTVVSMGRVNDLDGDGAETENRSQWGQVERLGYATNSFDLPFIRETVFISSLSEFWKLPPSPDAQPHRADYCSTRTGVRGKENTQCSAVRQTGERSGQE